MVMLMSRLSASNLRISPITSAAQHTHTRTHQHPHTQHMPTYTSAAKFLLHMSASCQASATATSACAVGWERGEKLRKGGREGGKVGEGRVLSKLRLV